MEELPIYSLKEEGEGHTPDFEETNRSKKKGGHTPTPREQKKTLRLNSNGLHGNQLIKRVLLDRRLISNNQLTRQAGWEV